MNVRPELINDCIDRDRKAEFELYKISYSYLMSICFRYTRNADKANEALNIGFLRILTHLKKYDSAFPFKTWARKVMINTLINEYKKEKKHHETVMYVEELFETDEFSDLNSAVTKMNADSIYALIARLPAACQQVFNLYFIDGFKHKEIAEMLEISEGTSKWHLNSARKKLKIMLEDIELPLIIAKP